MGFDFLKGPIKEDRQLYGSDYLQTHILTQVWNNAPNYLFGCVIQKR